MSKHIMLALIAICVALSASAPTRAAAPMPKTTATPAPTPAPPLSASEKRFVDAVTADLQRRFAKTSTAATAGYFRYTDEDYTGAISWVNTNYWKSDPQHPSQLWYDARGRLIGADWSVAKTAGRPHLWGISPSRWFEFEAHVHFGVKSGTIVKFGGAGPQSLAKIGGSLAHPRAADVVKLGKAKSVSEVAFAFAFPDVWDLEIWLVPNPHGAFAEANPNLKPSKSARPQM